MGTSPSRMFGLVQRLMQTLAAPNFKAMMAKYAKDRLVTATGVHYGVTKHGNGNYGAWNENCLANGFTAGWGSVPTPEQTSYPTFPAQGVGCQMKVPKKDPNVFA